MEHRRFGGALVFDGATSWVTVPDGSTLDLTIGLTLEAWVNPTASAGWQAVIVKERDQAGLSYALYSSSDSGLPDGTVNVGTDVSVLATSPLPSNTWSHLALTYDGTTLRIFVNGRLASAQPANGLLATAGTPLRIGGDSIWGEYFSGLIDEVRIYNRPLTANEIQVDMGTPIVP